MIFNVPIFQRYTIAMKRQLSIPQIGTLFLAMFSAAIGDTLLSRGMAKMGQVDLSHLGLLLRALTNPFIISGIVLLTIFFCSYSIALSWADLTYIMPATSFNYVAVALLSKFWLHEHITTSRWSGIFLIVCATGFVAHGKPRNAS